MKKMMSVVFACLSVFLLLNVSYAESTLEELYNGMVYNIDWTGSSEYNGNTVQNKDIIRAENKDGRITDILTGRTFGIKIQSAGNHMDVEPLTAKDTEVLCSLYSVANAEQLVSQNKWQRRAVVFTNAAGEQFVGSIYAQPHGNDTISDNNYDGQFCLHFLGSTIHGGGSSSMPDTENHQGKIAAGVEDLKSVPDNQGNQLIWVSDTYPGQEQHPPLSGGIRINEINFPDMAFRNYVKAQFDKNKDGTLSENERNSVSRILVPYEASSVIGIKHFPNLTTLDCNETNVTALDVSGMTKLKKLYCLVPKNAKIVLCSLNVTGCTALEELDCSYHALTTLDISTNTALVSLHCSANNLTELNIESNTKLESLSCADNFLTELNVSHLPNLKFLSCGGMNREGKLSTIDVSNNPLLDTLQCSNSNFTTLDVSKNPLLCELVCNDNQLSAIDVTHNPKLEILLFENNQVKEICLKNNPNLIVLRCSDNQLTELDLSQNKRIFILTCANNNIRTLDVSRLEIQNFECQGNQIEALDVGNFIAAEVFYCGNNRLTSMDVSMIPYDARDDYDFSNNQPSISINYDCTFDLANLPGHFDVSKATNWNGGSVSGTVLTVNEDATQVTYDYDCGHGYTAEFKLLITREAHTHVFDQEIPANRYLAAEATCTTPELYYKSCKCKEAGTETFENGQPKEHRFNGKHYACLEDGHARICTVCSELDTIEPHKYNNKNACRICGMGAYQIIEGAGQIVPSDTKEPILFRSNAEIKTFVEVQLNGSVLDPVHYTVREGSIIVELKPEFVRTLPDGEYTLAIISDDNGTPAAAVATFTVMEPSLIATLPQTGDNSHLMLYAAMMILSLTGILVISKRKKHA